MQQSVEPVQAAYIQHLVRARPALEDQLADVRQVLTAVTDGGELSEEGPLAFARAAYVAYLRDRHFTFDQLVADISAVCAGAYLLDLVG